jgi:hypothetical protein
LHGGRETFSVELMLLEPLSNCKTLLAALQAKCGLAWYVVSPPMLSSPL